MTPEHSVFYNDGLRFTCTRCSMCCRFDSGYVWVSDADLRLLADGLGLDTSSVVSRFCRTVDLGGLRQITLREQPNHDCVFWRDGSCSVYEHRPLQCRSYPFWDHQLASSDDWNRAAEHCPGIHVGRVHSRVEIDEWLRRRRADPPAQGGSDDL